MTKKKLSNKAFARIWSAVLALLLIVTLVGNYFAMKYSTIITRSLGHTTSKVIASTEPGDTAYFKSDFASHDELVARQKAFSRELVAEGIVLMQNDDAALPLPKGAKLSLFGIGSAKFLYGGQGSGAIDTSKCQSLKDALEAEGFAVNPTLYDVYAKSDAKVGKEEKPSGYLKSIEASVQEYSDAAILVLSRSGAEAQDIKPELLKLSKEELALVEYANDNFETVVVLLNTANAIEMGWADSEQYPHVKAVLWVGYPGQEGISSIAKALTGEVNPSGRLVDTYAFDSVSAPAAQFFDYGEFTNTNNEKGPKNAFTIYSEGIYVGYRYYETRYEDAVLGQGQAGAFDYGAAVQFPFGHGLSYTSFDYGDFSFTENDSAFTVSVKVTNSGKAAGKEVVQVYMHAPYTDYDRENLVEKSAVELVAFAKTAELAPGTSETVTLEIPKECMRAYDANKARTYIVDEGSYYFGLGRSSHDALNNILAAQGVEGTDAAGDASLVGVYEQKSFDAETYAVDSATGTAITNRFDNASMRYYDADYVYLSRQDWEATWPQGYGTPNKRGVYQVEASEQLVADSQTNPYHDDAEAVMPKTGSVEKLSLISMRGKAYDDEGWEAILDCLTVDEMVEMVRLGGWQTMAINSINKPMSSDQDGPAGISGELIMSNIETMGFPNQEMLAATWNASIGREFGLLIGEDGLSVNVQGWYAPGAGTHRTPLGGRNFEYYSEDGYLAGVMCAAEVDGAQSKGMYCYLKHLVLNDQEQRRYGISTFVTEQALRELYMTPFEMAVKQSDCRGMMAAFNGIGGVWCGANSALLTDVLTNEWGFHGIVVTDYASANESYMFIDGGLQAGADLWLNTDSEVYKLPNAASNPTLVTALRNASHDILYTVVNSSAMNGIDDGVEVVKIMPLWQKWLIAFDCCMGLVILLGAYGIVRRCKKNKEQ